MADRLNMIRAHLCALSLVEFSADSIITKLLKAGCPDATACEANFETDTFGMNESLARSMVNRLSTTVQ